MKLFHRLHSRTAFVLVLAAIGLLAANASASTGRIRVEGYEGHLGVELRTESGGLSFHGDRDFMKFDLRNDGESTIKVHLHVRPEEAGRFLLADEAFPKYARCSTLEAHKRCDVIVLFESKGPVARGTLEILDGTRPAYQIPLFGRK